MNESHFVFEKDYRGTGAVLSQGFLRQALPIATSYQRAVGFFSSSVFSVVDREFTEFFRRGARLEVICSPLFDASDVRALEKGLYSGGPETVETLERIHGAPRALRGALLLTWGIASGQMDLRIATMRSSTRLGIFHEKFGVFYGPEGRAIGFLGSPNESLPAYVSNYERIKVYAADWGSEDRRVVEQLIRDFDALWQNKTDGLRVIPLHEAFRSKIIQMRTGRSEESTEVTGSKYTEMASQPEILRAPARLHLRPYQEAAVAAWFASSGRGILAMATGTGKTITALAIANKLDLRVGPPLIVIIVAPLLNLVDQWDREAREFGLAPIKCIGSQKTWDSHLESAIFMANTGRRSILSIIATNATFAGTAFQQILKLLRVRTLLIVDEVHHLGARQLRNALPERVQLRLGLSATPIRSGDPVGTDAVQRYFGGVVYNFDLEAAIRAKPPVLSPYAYYPVTVELTEDETDEYLRITRALARTITSPESEELSEDALRLLLQRARLVAGAQRKLPALREVIEPFRESFFNLVYCGDGRTELESVAPAASSSVDEAPLLRQVDAVAKLLGGSLRMAVSKYTSETPADERERLLSDFETRRLQALIAIRCLDEGVDIPAVRRAFILASSTNPGQFVQRRGRLLRLAEGKDHAEIYDFIVVPPIEELQSDSREFFILRRLVSREMKRVVEFARLASNSAQARGRLLPILSRLHLLDL